MRVLRLTPHFDWSAIGAGEATEWYPAVGGLQAQVLRQTLELGRRGIEQLVLTLPMPQGPRKWSVEGLDVEVRGTDGWLAALPGKPPGAIGQHLGWLMGVERELAAHDDRFDLIHVHSTCVMWPALAGLWARSRLGLPLVVTVHCSSRATYRPVSRRDAAVQAVGRRVERSAICASAGTMVLTQRTYDRFLADGIASPSNLSIVPDCVDVEGFRAEARAERVEAFATRHGLSPAEPLVVFLGRISEEKGWRAVLEVADELRDTARVMICGVGEDEPLLRSEVSRLGLRDRVVLCGLVAPGAVPAALACADVLLLPSTFEEFGSVALEAMAMGLPCVAYDVAGVPEAVIDGQTGVVVGAGDVAAMAAAARRLLGDPRLARRLGEQGLDRVRRRHDLATCCDRIMGVYERALRL